MPGSLGVSAASSGFGAAAAFDTLDETYDGPAGAGSGALINLDSGCVDLNWIQTSGTGICIDANAAVVQDGAAVGIAIEFATNFTAGAFDQDGLRILLSSDGGGIRRSIIGDTFAIFRDGDAVFGALVMSGTEKLRILGDVLIQGKLTVTGAIDPTDIDIDADGLTTNPAHGGLLSIRFSGVTVQTGTFVGLNVDLATNMTGGANAQDGLSILLASDGAGVRRTLIADGCVIFRDGDVAFGATAMVGTERLRIVGSSLFSGVIESTLATGTAPFTVASTTVVANLNASTITGIAGAELLQRDGSVALTANWDVGAFTITGTQFISDIAIGTAPFVVTSTTVVANLNAATVAGIAGAEFIQRDGSVALTANWDVGAFEVRALIFQSDQATGTAPFTVASTTVVTNLNADTVDSIEGAELLQRDGSVALTANWDVGAFTVTMLRLISDQATGTAPFTVASTTAVANLTVTAIEESGATRLTFGAIADGQALQRSGTAIIGVAAFAGNTLDSAYDEGGAGIGRTITVSTGSVQLTNSQTSGTVLDINSGVVSLAGAFTGLNIDLNTNVTGGANEINGLNIDVGATSNASSNIIFCQTLQTRGTWVLMQGNSQTLAAATTGLLIDMLATTPGANAVTGINVLIPGSNGNSRGIDIDYRATIGQMILGTVGAPTTLTNFLGGLRLDLTSNITAGANQVVGVLLEIPGSSSAATRAIDIDTRQTAGTIIEATFGASTTLSANLNGIVIDLSTNVTPGANRLRGLDIVMGASTATTTRSISVVSAQTGGNYVVVEHLGAVVTAASGLTGIAIVLAGLAATANFVRGFTVTLPASSNAFTNIFRGDSAQTAGSLITLVGTGVLTAIQTGIEIDMAGVTRGGFSVIGLVVNVDNVADTVISAEVGGTVNSILFGDGDLALGTTGMSGTEKLRVEGASFLNGDVGFHGTAPVAQSAAYTRNATIVEDRTLLASASASIINNNNVLAAIIADLQTNGLFG